MVLPLIGIIAVIFFAYWAVSWFGKKYKNSLSSGKNVKILERTMLGQDKSLVLAQMKDKVYLLGVTNNGIEILDTLDAAEFPASEENGTKSDFSEILSSMMMQQLPFKGKLKDFKEKRGKGKL
jgi:flagellar biosynthetic protein FliO